YIVVYILQYKRQKQGNTAKPTFISSTLFDARTCAWAHACLDSWTNEHGFEGTGRSGGDMDYQAAGRSGSSHCWPRATGRSVVGGLACQWTCVARRCSRTGENAIRANARCRYPRLFPSYPVHSRFAPGGYRWHPDL